MDPNTGWEMHGVLWKRGQLIDLGTLDGGPLERHFGSQQRWRSCGLSLNLIQDPYSMWGFYQTRAFRWKDGTMIDLGTLGCRMQ